jgi:hypothetical protein
MHEAAVVPALHHRIVQVISSTPLVGFFFFHTHLSAIGSNLIDAQLYLYLL